jgi:5-methylcytosine-specific restriction protein A
VTPYYRENKRKAPRQEKDALGRRLCRRCKKLVGKGLRSYCSRECRNEFEIEYFPQYTRKAVFHRDKGVCAKCGTDTDLIRRIGSRLRRMGGGGYGTRGWDLCREFFTAIGFKASSSAGDFWQADHIHECARGGWGTGLSNLRTLCTPCHKQETARLARELAESRRLAKAPIAESLWQ